MRKKLIVLLTIIACIFGLTACGSESQSEYEVQKLESAQEITTSYIIPFLTQFTAPELNGYFDDYTAEEVEYIVESKAGIEVDGNAVKAAIESFTSANETMGGITSIGATSAKIDGSTIIVSVNVIGAKKNAKAEVIVSNDMFLKLESASLNPESTMGELMGKAGLNTLIGMGTVFIVLILISLIISLFGFIPKIQKSLADKKTAKEAEKKANDKTAGIDNAVAQITAQEEEAVDDYELVAVIAAAIAASEGTSTDGFVVRSIRRRA